MMLGGERLESSPAEKDLRILVGDNRTYCATAAQKTIAPWAASPAAWPQVEEGD